MSKLDPVAYGGGPRRPTMIPGPLGNARIYTGENMLDAFALAVARGTLASASLDELVEQPEQREKFARFVFDFAETLCRERDRRAALALSGPKLVE